MIRRDLIRGAAALLAASSVSISRAQTESDADFLLRRMALDPNAPHLGNPAGDITLVEFFDYNCPVCRKSHPVIEAGLSEDPGLKLAFRHWPIFGPGSTYAARAALAADKVGRFAEFHRSLITADAHIDAAFVDREAAKLGFERERLDRDMQSAATDEHLSDSKGLAAVLGFAGTPMFVVGGKAFAGGMEPDALRSILRKARAG